MSENQQSMEDRVLLAMQKLAKQYYEWQKCYRLMQEIWEAMRTQKDWNLPQRELIGAVPAFREDLRRTVRKSDNPYTCLTPRNAQFLWSCDSQPFGALTTDLTLEDVEQGIISDSRRQKVQEQRNQEKS
jgi:hypothetical protein